MPAFSASAPGKIILFGEHAVVYHRPAIAVPVCQVSAKATVMPNPRGQTGMVRIQAPDIHLDALLADLPDQHPLAAAVYATANALGAAHIPSCTLRIKSTIPVAAGLGSGAAVSVAIIRSLAAYLGHPLPEESVSKIAFEIEKIHHGTPSGIDNTVVTYARPVYFIKGQPIQQLRVGKPFTIVIGDTGIASLTAKVVGDVRKAWQKHKAEYEAMFDSAGAIADSARQAIEKGSLESLAPLIDANHGLLRKMGVSCPELEALVQAARKAGALGAKLSGGGRGGNMIALVNPERAEHIAAALKQAGAVNTVITRVSG
ncbi:MAG: mevalonate kinase [Anaerolineales bacterium]|nr:mevalonate kinase [Anaerolineales bacterium]